MAGMRFGRTLRSYIAQRDISPQSFARAARISPGYLSKLILRAGINPSSDVLVRIVFAFETFGPGKALTDAEIRQLLVARGPDDSAAQPRAA